MRELATLSVSSLSVAITAIAAVSAFVIGTVWRPTARDRDHKRTEAEKLAIEAAVRNRDVDQRLAQLTKVAEAHERRLSQIETAVWRMPPVVTSAPPLTPIDSDPDL